MRRFAFTAGFPVSRSCGGISGLGLTSLLNAGQSACRRLRHRLRRLDAGEEAAHRTAREECHLAVHERRRQSRGHVRSQACVEQVTPGSR